MRSFAVGAASLLSAAILLTACASMRRETAENAQNKMVGLSKERLLACMGPPANRTVEGTGEVWSYNSRGYANGRSSQQFCTTKLVTVFGSSCTDWFSPPTRPVAATCRVHIVMDGSQVTQVSYVGPPEQCGFVVENCIR
jgi:hypothetical protein